MEKDIEEYIKRLEKRIKDTEDYNINQVWLTDDVYAVKKVINRVKELEEDKKITELTKITCCTAQNCEALNNAIREGLENNKLRERIAELEEELDRQINTRIINEEFIEINFISKSKIKEKIKELDKNERERINKIKKPNEMFPDLIYISNKFILEQLLKEVN